MIDALWRRSARLFVWHADRDSAVLEKPVQIAAGSLEEMIIRATEALDDDVDSVAIECEGLDRALGRSEIEELRREPSFPVEI